MKPGRSGTRGRGNGARILARVGTAILAAFLLGAGVACDGAPEWGDPDQRPIFDLEPIDTPRIEPGANGPGGPIVSDAGPEEASRGDRYEGNVYATDDGRRLYSWYNCSGCHGEGGGSIGPPLWDADWTYGGSPEDIAESIIQGRPEGMPAFGGRIPADHVWKLVAYLRQLDPEGGLVEGWEG